ncbi:MAG: nucleotide pyrophosphohydrolase [Candidatus Thorarchaeota archaeon]|nr:MAG: nucleotide pyrophosphohydrolase [Candidatus Thorarchaeota archaeon]
MSYPDYSLRELIGFIKAFVDERNWHRFHTPSALALSAAIELGELLELFQWRSEEDVVDALADNKFKESLSQEIADVLIYLLRLTDVAGIDPSAAIIEKLKKNALKYPSKEWRGRAPNKTRTDR